MDRGQHRCKWRRQCILYIFVLLPFLWKTEIKAENDSGSAPVTCKKNEYDSINGICCNKCPPGSKLVKECPGEGLRSTCETCANGTYMDQTNYARNCFRCDKCRQYEEEKSPCTHETNRECVCTAGYYREVISAIIWNCKRCTTCGSGERMIRQCTHKENTVCECKDYHYRVSKRSCAFCKNCSEECRHLCPTLSPSTPKIQPSSVLPTPVSAFGYPFLVAVLLVMIVALSSLFIFRTIRQWRKKKRALNSSQSPDPEKHIMKQDSNSTCSTNLTEEEKDVLLTSHVEKPEVDWKLPDCVPREIKTHKFIYFVLEMVPISRFKELVRRLNVSEQDIDRAERDNRAYSDAQYQMLKVWSDNGPGEGRNVLPRKLLQEFVDKLRDMSLNNCAESIEDKFC